MENRRTATDFGVTREEFELWRLPREGTTNPTPMDNAVWKWLIATKISGYQAKTEMRAESGLGATWSFDRFGQSSTTLADGRIVLIGGEHEDYYDPDFYIYNDVVVQSPDGEVRIFGYPITIFPPTDFHSATLVGDNIYVIGNLGYTATRKDQLEHIHILNTNSFAFVTERTTGDNPGWIHGHQASVVGDIIRVSGGKVDLHAKKILAENLSTWELNLGTLIWKLVERKNWRRWEFRRIDRKPNSIWSLRSAVFNKRYNGQKELDEELARLTKALGRVPDLDLVENLYRSNLPSNYLGVVGEEYGTYRLEIDNVIIRFVESQYIQMTIEGTLPEEVCNQLVAEMKGKLVALEAHEYEAEEIP